MTKILSLNNNKIKKENKKNTASITIMSDGMFYSGSSAFAHKIYMDFTHNAISVGQGIKCVERQNNINIDLQIAKKEEIDQHSLYELKENQEIIPIGVNGKDLLITIEKVTPKKINAIWMNLLLNDQTDFYEDIGRLMIDNVNTMNIFIDNCEHAIDCESVNGDFENEYLDDVYNGLKKINSFKIEEYKECITRANPKETFEFMGLQLQPTSHVVTKLHIIN